VQVVLWVSAGGAWLPLVASRFVRSICYVLTPWESNGHSDRGIPPSLVCPNLCGHIIVLKGNDAGKSSLRASRWWLRLGAPARLGALRCRCTADALPVRCRCTQAECSWPPGSPSALPHPPCEFWC